MALVRAASCPHCDSSLRWSGDGGLAAALDARRDRWRLLGYLLVAVASSIAGTVPLAQFGVQIAALFILHVVLLRRELVWLPAGRRLLARLTIKLIGAAVACLALLINVAIAPFLGVSVGVLGVVGPVLTAIYVEGGLTIIRQRTRWEVEGRPLAVAEWALPALVSIALIVAVAGTVGAVMGTLHLLATMEIPTISDLAKGLTELGS